jgi:hypothetical protein
MATALDQIVDIVITQSTAAVPQAGFGVPLVVGPKGFSNSDVLRYYSDPKEMLGDGFLTSDAEYIYAVEAFEQTLTPELIGIGKRTTAVAQVDTITPTAVNLFLYIITISGTDYQYTSDGTATVSEIVSGLLALVNADTNCKAAATGTVTLILTGKTPGDGFTTSVNANPNLALIHTTTNNGIQDDITKILTAPNGDNWYGLALCSNVVGDILQAAALTETLKKIFIAASGDSAIDSGSTTDVASVLKGKGYKRTALMFSPASYNAGMDAAWLGGQLPQTPGASTWMFKSLTGISPDSYTGNQRATLIGTPGVTTGKGANIYENTGGVPITKNGWMCGGQYIDVTVGLDWLESTMQTNVFALLVNNPKIPYTDKGLAVIENAVRQTLKQGSDDGGNGLLDHTSITVTTVPVASIPANTRAARILPFGSVVFSARLTGAFHNIVINGNVSV